MANSIVFTTLLAIVLGCAHSQVFPLGVQFEYALENTVVINDLRAGEYNSSIKLKADLKVTKIWEAEKKNLLVLSLLSPTLHGNDKLFALPQSEETFLLEFDAEDTNVYLPNSDVVSMRNLKRGIASLFQFSPEKSPKTEIGVTGECTVAYDELTDRRFVKRKMKCKTDDRDSYHRKEEPLGVAMPNARNTEYLLDVSESIESIENIEFFRISLAGNDEVGATVDSRLSLKLVSQKDAKEQTKSTSYSDVFKKYKNLQRFTITYEQEEKEVEEKSDDIIKLVKQYKKNLANSKIGTEKLSFATVKLVEAARKAKVDDLTKILNARSTRDYRGQLMDVLGAAQTIDSHDAVKKVLKFSKSEDFPHVERYLQSLAVGSQPKPAVVKDLLEMLRKDNHENEKYTETLIQTISSMASNLADKDEIGKEVFQEVQKYFTNIVEKTTKVPRRVTFLQGFVNLKSAESIPMLLNYVLTGPKAVSVTAMKALVSMPREYFRLEHVKHLESIYHQKRKRFDSSVRTLAVEILLDPLFYQSSLKDMIYALKYSDSYEVKQYFIQRLKMESEKDESFRNFAMEIIREDATLNNYHIFGTQGLSTALSRKFLTSPSFNSTLVSIQEIDRGILKRGIVDMIFESKKDKFSYFTIGLYADGLTSFVSSNSNADDNPSDAEESETMAGMELVVQGSYLRPLQFFRGQGELMGHVWSGSASDLTPAYQATTLLHDHKEVIWLQNGMRVTIDVMGAMSLNLNGQVTISIWYRNAKSRVLQEIGFAVTGRVSIENDYAEIGNNFVVLQEPKLDLVSDIDFSSESIICMQLSQPNYVLKTKHTKTANIEGIKTKFQNESRRKYNIPGYTHFLNQKNNEICNKIHS
ncbi:microsomal triacylglycerol transfer protein [Phlebotomus argentipes]|uniref:microsomal triacylglycerol transfer protein n=1 Tax=Phlebotomus argentipes TaxID=94469 RepID=UPI0028937049|nr:microsomal triacylglycerol transfer protein [Phlebotomus argentipes]